MFRRSRKKAHQSLSKFVYAIERRKILDSLSLEIKSTQVAITLTKLQLTDELKVHSF